MEIFIKYASVFFVLLTIACNNEKSNNIIPKDTINNSNSTNDIKKSEDTKNTTNEKNNPPVLYKIGDKIVKAGENLTIKLKAYDPDGDPLFYSVYGDIPSNATFHKDTGEFSYTPKIPGKSLFLTFVVSDGKAFDRETVEIKVVSEKSKNPPEFVTVGAQNVKPDNPYSLQLQASDPDGDTLYFSTQGSLPPGSQLDQNTGKFTWTPTQSDAGKVYRVTFSVSDGFLSDTMEIQFIVEGAGVNHPPQFKPINNMQVVVGEKIELKIEATDIDSEDTLIFGTDGDLPQGAKFYKTEQKFEWTPAGDGVGKTFSVTFFVNDGHYTVYLTVKFTVNNKESGTNCENDANEPNNSLSQATKLAKGNYTGLTICPSQGEPDIDWYSVTLQKGDLLSVNIQADKNLDTVLFKKGNYDDLLSWGDSEGKNEKMIYLATEAGEYLFSIFAPQLDGSVISSYSLGVDFVKSYTCSDDVYENNDKFDIAYDIPESFFNTTLDNMKICPGDIDIYRTAFKCGDFVSINLFYSKQDGDIELFLVQNDKQTQAGESVAIENGRKIDMSGITKTDDYYIVVEPSPFFGVENKYSMKISVQAGSGCTDDSLEPNNSPDQATKITKDTKFDNLKLCCDDDWSTLQLSPGQSMLAEVKVSGDAKILFDLLDQTGTKVIKSSTGLLDYENNSTESQTLFFRVRNISNTINVSYSLEVIFISDQSSKNSCKGQCDKNPGNCWCDKGCFDYGDCCDDICSECGYCPEQTTCGNNKCEIGESCSNCEIDCGKCGSQCGNNQCEENEDCQNCPKDCGECDQDCCKTYTTPGCSDKSIEQCVCKHDSYCCDTQWDSTCINEIKQYECGTCE